MTTAGNYLYGFTDAAFRPEPDLRGLGGAPVQVLAFRDVAAVVSRHPVRPLMPLRSNLEPHHRIVRRVSREATLVPAAFGHISESEEQLLGVVRANYEDIRRELVRLRGKYEMTVKLSWNVENIFEHLVRTDRELRELRDRIFKGREPSMNEKLQVGSQFEKTMTRERARLTARLLGAFGRAAADSVVSPPRSEKTVCQAALLIARERAEDFADALHAAAGLFEAHSTLEYSGPWPPYSFVQLRLQPAGPGIAA